jgi:predicted RNase H-related nuclease YkuK (DUF458 family)
MLSEKKINQIREVLKASSPESRVYIGNDSSRHRDKQDVWHATYTTAVVIHMIDEHGMGHGCRVFTETQKMVDYDNHKSKPFTRMMQECYLAVEAYQQLEEDLLEHDVEVHLDINKSEMHGSNVAHNAAVGYAVGVTGRPVKTKPEAFAASYVADHGVRDKFARENVTLH